MSIRTKSISYTKIQPLRGWDARFVCHTAFHTVLLKLNPFGILNNNIIVKTIGTKNLAGKYKIKSPKDFNMNNPERSSGYRQKQNTQP